MAFEAVELRTARESDAEAAARIYIDSWNAGFGGLLLSPNRTVTPRILDTWCRDLSQPPPHRWWVAERERTMVGFAGIGPSRDPMDPLLGELDTIAVDPSCWRTGIGRALMALALLYLKTDGYREAILWTVAGYERGQRFYEAMGWCLDGGLRDEGRQVRYRRQLAAERTSSPPVPIRPLLLAGVDGLLNPYGSRP